MPSVFLGLRRWLEFLTVGLNRAFVYLINCKKLHFSNSYNFISGLDEPPPTTTGTARVLLTPSSPTSTWDTTLRLEAIFTTKFTPRGQVCPTPHDLITFYP
jgi:hypothetical protein